MMLLEKPEGRVYDLDVVRVRRIVDCASAITQAVDVFVLVSLESGRLSLAVDVVPAQGRCIKTADFRNTPKDGELIFRAPLDLPLCRR